MASRDELVLDWGAHSRPEDGMCVMEAVSLVAGEPFGDDPGCVAKVVAAFLRRWNDDLDDAARQMLKPYVPRLVAAAPGQDEAQAWLASDWLVRELAPAFLRPAGLEQHASALEALAPLTGPAEAEAAGPSLGDAQGAAAEAARPIPAGGREADGDPRPSAVRAAAWAYAWEAARSAGWGAAGSAMWAAVDGTDPGREAPWTAAGDAARIAAWDAARVVAWRAASAAADGAPDDGTGDAAWAAARDAARAALRPAVERLQRSALALLDRLLEFPTDRQGVRPLPG